MVSIIGIGMDGEKTLTSEALSAIKKADKALYISKTSGKNPFTAV